MASETAVARETVLVIGGRARSLARHRGSLMVAMKAAGHDVTAIAPDDELLDVAMLEELGVPFVGVPLRRVGRSPLQDVTALWSLVRLMRRRRPDVVLSYTIKPVIYGSLAARLVGVPRSYALVTGLGQAFADRSPAGRLLARLVSRLYRLGLSSVERVFFQNPDDAAEFIDRGIMADPSRVQLVNGSGVDLEHFRRVPPVLKPLTFLWMGRVLNDKGLLELIEIAPQIKRQCPDALIHLLGFFDERHPAALSRRQVAEWERAGLVEFLGTANDVRPYLEQASVLVYPSYREGTPRAVLEAMAMGRPVITTDAPGCRETIRDGYNGFQIPVRDSAALLAAMQRFVEDRGLIRELGDNAYQLASEKYDVHKVNRTMLRTMNLI